MGFYSTGFGVIRRWLVLFAIVAVAPVASADGKLGKTNAFAVDMARGGNWREAYYRWAGIEERHADDPRLLNNLAVAAEALGRRDEALDYYRRALAADAEADPRLARNVDSFVGFWNRTLDEEDAPEFLAALEAIGTPKVSAGKKGKVERVEVGLPVPPRLDLDGTERVLVISFLTDEMMFLDANREIVRFVRSELRKHTALPVLDVTPAPSVPEQTLDDLVANDGFWRFVADEFDADIVISGYIGYLREDVSGFREIDEIHPTTGQKVRRTRFVEQEEFAFEMEVLFMNGRDGTLLHRDRFRRKIRYLGSQNDPITAFYQMTDSLAEDLLAIVETRRTVGTRFVFSK